MFRFFLSQPQPPLHTCDKKKGWGVARLHAQHFFAFCGRTERIDMRRLLLIITIFALTTTLHAQIELDMQRVERIYTLLGADLGFDPNSKNIRNVLKSLGIYTENEFEKAVSNIVNASGIWTKKSCYVWTGGVRGGQIVYDDMIETSAELIFYFNDQIFRLAKDHGQIVEYNYYYDNILCYKGICQPKTENNMIADTIKSMMMGA